MVGMKILLKLIGHHLLTSDAGPRRCLSKKTGNRNGTS